MVKFIHMADTHLGYREGKGTINKWAIKNYSKPYEQEIYDVFLNIIDDISKMKDIDFVIHCGDIFHHPHIYSSYPPPEPARRILIDALDLFFEKTQNKIPFIYIEGNHGVFRGYEYTPFESHVKQKNYPNLHYFKEKDLIEAIKSNNPLELELIEKKTRFFLFPYFEFKSHEAYKSAYNNWIKLQKPTKNDGFINIAVAHGSEADDTLHKKLKSDDFGYHYIALGHEHGLKSLTKNRYYSGSLLPMNFKERFESQGYLIVDIDGSTNELNVEKVYTDRLLKRRFDLIEIEISPQDSSVELIQKINNELLEHTSSEGFDPKTSSRLKLNFIGEMTYEKVWLINEVMTKIRRDCFSQPEKYNILQLIWQTSDVSEIIEDDISTGLIEDYILEKPDDDFKKFVEEKLSDEKSQFNVDKLTDFGMKAIKKALKIMEKDEEV